MKSSVRILLALFFLCCTASVSLFAVTWVTRPTSAERIEAMKNLQQFALDFAGEKPASEEARALVERDAKTDDPVAWIGEVTKFAAKQLQSYPVCPENEVIRRRLLHILDHPVHVDTHRDQTVRKTWSDAFGEYTLDALKKVVDEVEKTKVPAGKLAIWKIYNMAFVVKSEHHTIGFDIHTIASWLKRDDVPPLYKRLAKQLDIGFVSHFHGDHFSQAFADAMRHEGKGLVFPDDSLSRPPRATKDQTPRKIPFDGSAVVYDRLEPVGDLAIRSIPGTQGNLKNSLFLVTLDGLTILHCGDNTDGIVFDKLPLVGRVDVLLSNCWSFTPNMQLAVMSDCDGGDAKPDRPQFCISGHENELGHGYANRESFLEIYHKLGNRTRLMPTFIVSYGENVCYPSGRALEKDGLSDAHPHAIPPANPAASTIAARPRIQIQPGSGQWLALTDKMGQPVENAPKARLSYDKETHALRFDVEFAHAAPVAKQTERDSAVYDDDAVEFFLGSDLAPDYYQFCVNVNGAVFDSRNRNPKWNAALKCEGKKQANNVYLITLVIPLKDLRTKGTLNGNIAILDKKTGMIHNLVATQGDFHETGSYAELILPNE